MSVEHAGRLYLATWLQVADILSDLTTRDRTCPHMCIEHVGLATWLQVADLLLGLNKEGFRKYYGMRAIIISRLK